MTKSETIIILTLLSSNYESFERRLIKDKDNMINLWFTMLKDIEFINIENAIKKHIVNSPYPPTIHDIRTKAFEINETTSIEAWEEAFQMISNGLYMREEQFEQASPIVKKFFGSVKQLKEIAMIESDIINTVTKGQFLKQYEVLKTRTKEEIVMLPEIKDMVKLLSEKMGR